VKLQLIQNILKSGVKRLPKQAYKNERRFLLGFCKLLVSCSQSHIDQRTAILFGKDSHNALKESKEVRMNVTKRCFESLGRLSLVVIE
jgi:hypothetical protein